MSLINKILNFFIRAKRKVVRYILKPFWKISTIIIFKAFNVEYKKFYTNGVPKITISNSGTIKIGDDFKMNNNYSANLIGRQQPCIFIVRGGNLIIGNNVGVSSLAIVCHKQISIGDNVKIGGNTVIYDTDFHSLNTSERTNIPEIIKNIKTKSVKIGNNVFIGGHTTILKGVTIGDNSIIGAGSVVSKNIPPNEIWGGNPVRRIKRINE